MSYNEIKSNLDSERKQYIKKRRVIQGYENDLTLIQSEREKINNNFLREIDVAKDRERKRQEDDLVQPIEIEIKKLESEKVALKQEYTRLLEDITEEKYMSRETGSSNISKEVKESLGNLKDTIESVLGTRFQKELLLQLHTGTIELNESDLETFDKRFKKLTAKVERMKSKSNVNYVGLVEKVFIKINPEKTQATGKTMLIYLGICLVIAGLLFYFAYSLVIIGIALLMALNISKNYQILSAILELKSVDDNLSSLERMVQEKIKQEVANDRAELETEYNSNLSVLDEKIDTLSADVTTKVRELRRCFVFDDSSMRQNLDLSLKNIDNREASITASLTEARREVDPILLRISQLEKELEKAAGALIYDYMNLDKPGKETILNPLFLIDIVDSKPVFFNYPETSCLFVYDDRDDVVSLIRLMSIQLLSRLNVFNLSIQVWDKRYLGTEYQVFCGEGKDKTDEIFKVCSNSEMINTSLDALVDIVSKRTTNIKREFANIKEYNNRMLELESLTESYMFMFIQDLDAGLVTNDGLKQLMINGGDLGIFANIFISEEEFNSMGDTAIQLVKSINRVYYLKTGELLERAKDFVLESLEKE